MVERVGRRNVEEAEQLHEGERADDRRRDGKCGDERDAKVPDEEKDDQAREQAAEDQVQLDVFERSPDESRLVVADADLKILRQLRLNALEALLYAVDDFHRVRARLLANLHAERRRAAQACRAADLLNAILHPADIAECDDRPVGAVGEDDTVEIFDVLDAAHRPHGDVGRPCGELTARNLDVLALHRVSDLIDRQPIGDEPVGIHQQLDFTLPFAVVSDRADISDRLEVLLHPFFGDLGDFLGRARAVNGKPEDRLRVRIHLRDLQRPRVARKLVDDLRQLVAHVLGGRLDVALEGERDRDPRVPLVRRCAQLVDAADRVDRLLDTLRNRGLDFLGARTGEIRLDRHDRRVGFRHQVETERLVRHGAQHDERRRHHDREDRPPHADFGQLHSRAPLRPPPCAPLDPNAFPSSSTPWPARMETPVAS